MDIDNIAISDLNILPTDREERSLSQVLDHTHSSLGRLALLARLRSPLRSAQEITGVQSSCRFLATHASDVRAILLRAQPDNVRSYLDSSLEGLSNSQMLPQFIEHLWLRVRYASVVVELTRGLESAKGMVDSLAGLESLLRAAPPGPLTPVIEAIENARGRLNGPKIETRRPHTVFAALRLDARWRRDDKALFEGVLEAMAAVDAMLSLGLATLDNRWEFPKLVAPEQDVWFEGLYHPLVVDAVPNDFRVEGGRGVVILTGPNTAGKSTFLRAAGIAVYLTHLGCGIPAQSAEVPLFDALFTSMNVTDSVVRGESLFLAEARRLKRLLTMLSDDRRVFALLDEPLKGTNLLDAREAISRVAGSLAKTAHTVTLVASHVLDYESGLAEPEHLRWQHFTAVPLGDRLVCDYRMHTGLSAQRLGMHILEKEGVLRLLARLEKSARAAFD